jgi:hypothetical protein
MSDFTVPEKTAARQTERLPDSLETWISMIAIISGVIAGFMSSSFLLGILIWLLLAGLGMGIKKKTDEVGLKHVPAELVTCLFSKVRQELAELDHEPLSICRTCGSSVALNAPICPHCGINHPGLDVFKRTLSHISSGLNKLAFWLMVACAVGIILGVLTNPNENSLKTYARNRLQDKSGKISAAIAEPFLTTKHHNFIVFSVGEIRSPVRTRPEIVIGCLGSWYLIKPSS